MKKTGYIYIDGRYTVVGQDSVPVLNDDNGELCFIKLSDNTVKICYTDPSRFKDHGFVRIVNVVDGNWSYINVSTIMEFYPCRGLVVTCIGADNDEYKKTHKIYGFVHDNENISVARKGDSDLREDTFSYMIDDDHQLSTVLKEYKSNETPE